MALVWIADSFKALDIGNRVRNWRTTPEGTVVRASCQAKPLKEIGDSNNRLMGRHPKIHFHMPQPITAIDTTQADASGSNPL